MVEIDLSIIIPCYNSEKTILRCLNSITTSSLYHFEILLIDDGSTDNTKMVLESYFDNPIFKYYYKENGGLSSARNFGLELAKGKYIAFLDSDDWVQTNAYVAGLDLLFLKNGNIVHFNTKICTNIKQDNKILQYSNSIKIHQPHMYILRKSIKNSGVEFSVCNKIYKNNVIKNLRFRNLKYEDVLFNYELYMNIEEVYYIKNYYYFYYKGEINSLTKSDYSKKDLDIFLIEKYIRDLKYNKLFNQFIISFILSLMLKIILSKKEFPQDFEYLKSKINFCNKFSIYFSKIPLKKKLSFFVFKYSTFYFLRKIIRNENW